jgi:hypothetical protein
MVESCGAVKYQLLLSKCRRSKQSKLFVPNCVLFLTSELLSSNSLLTDGARDQRFQKPFLACPLDVSVWSLRVMMYHSVIRAGDQSTLARISKGCSCIYSVLSPNAERHFRRLSALVYWELRTYRLGTTVTTLI